MKLLRCWAHRDCAPSPLRWPQLTTSHGSGGSRQLCPQRHLQSSGDSLGTFGQQYPAVGHFISLLAPADGSCHTQGIFCRSAIQFLPRLGVATTISLDWMLSLELTKPTGELTWEALKLRSKKGYLPRDVYSFPTEVDTGGKV